MKRKFKIGDIVAPENYPEDQYKIIDFTKDSKKLVKGDWADGKKERLVPPNCYVVKNLKNNKLYSCSIKHLEKHCQLIQPVKEEPLPPLEWNGLKEIIV